jgi:hypothetical protein
MFVDSNGSNKTINPANIVFDAIIRRTWAKNLLLHVPTMFFLQMTHEKMNAHRTAHVSL